MRLSLVSAIACLACIVATPARVVAQSPEPPGRLIEVGAGQRMHLLCSGRDSPTVVLEAGAGAFSFVWSLVQPLVSTTSRVCSYDRAGFAWSDPGALPRTTEQLSLELHLALERAGEHPPFVLVGHSFGGQLVRGYADRYPGDVAGMVLVDAPHENHRFQTPDGPQAIRASATGRTSPAATIHPDAGLQRLRSANVRSVRTDTILESPLDRLPADARRWWRWAEGDSAYRIAYDAEMAWSPEEMQRLFVARQGHPRSLGDRPLIVVARTYATPIADSLTAERRRQQLDLATLSTQGQVRFARQSGHNVEIEEPETVVQAIRDVVAAVRRRRPTR